MPDGLVQLFGFDAPLRPVAYDRKKHLWHDQKLTFFVTDTVAWVPLAWISILQC
jgi:hypothetical protein